MADERGAGEEGLTRPLVRPQVDLALAVTEFGVAHPTPLVAEAVTALGEEHPLAHEHRELAAARTHDLALGPHPVPEIEAGEGLEVGRLGLLGEELDRA